MDEFFRLIFKTNVMHLSPLGAYRALLEYFNGSGCYAANVKGVYEERMKLYSGESMNLQVLNAAMDTVSELGGPEAADEFLASQHFSSGRRQPPRKTG